MSSVGRGGTGLAWSWECAGHLMNPALGGTAGISTGFGQEYALREFSHEFVTGTVKARDFRASAALDAMGDERYSEIRGGLAGSSVVGRDWRVGASVILHRLEIAGLRSGNAAGATVGVAGHLSKSVRGAMVWRNIGGPRISNYQDRLPESIAAGVMTTIDRRTRAGIDVLQEEGFPLDMRGGIETDIHKMLALRFGARAQPVQYAAGVGVRYRTFRVNYAMNWHPELGASHVAGLDILW